MSSQDAGNVIEDSVGAASAAPEPMPRAVRFGLVSALGLLLSGAVYLIVMRGEAILVDLSALGSKVWCF